MSQSSTGFLDVPGGQIYYEVEGDGHPLLLIHGGLGNLRMWDGQIETFTSEFTVIRYDTRGFGRTETEDIEFSEVEDAKAVLDHFGAECAFVIGQSRGGMFGLDLALEYPERVDALVSVASGVGGFHVELPEEQRPPWEEMEKAWTGKEWEKLAELETQVWVDGWGQPTARIDPALRAKVKNWIESTYKEEKIEGKPQQIEPLAIERLSELNIPVLVMVGLVDEAAGVAAGRHLAKSVAGAELVEFPGVAHMIQLERPQEFNDLALDFLLRARQLSHH